MRYRLFIIIWIMILQIACGNMKPKAMEKSPEPKIALAVESKDEHNQVRRSTSDTLDSKKLFISDEVFPIIMYGMPNSDKSFEKVKKWGATHVQKYGMGKSIKQDQIFFDRAEKFGLKVMSALRAKYWLKGNKNLDHFREYIIYYSEHPALSLWYLTDEPDNKRIRPNDLTSLYELIKEETPNIMVANAHAWTQNWYKYGDVQDILLYDYYPVYADPFPKAKLSAWTNFTESAFKRGNADSDLVFPVVQIFNWKSFANDGQRKLRNYSVENLRYPNSLELRYMIFSSIAFGARGISLFSYSRLKMVDANWGDQILAPVLKEVKEFVMQIYGARKAEFYILKGKDIFLTLWSNDRTEFIVLANATPNERKIKLNVNTAIKDLKGFTPWGQSRKSVNIFLSDEELIVNNIKPWEIIIMKKN